MADNALEPSLIPFWPFGLPQQSRRCRTVSLTDEARPLLLRLQRTRLSALAGQHVASPWTRQLKRKRVTETLRKLCFLTLGPLWEDAERPALVQHAGADTAQVPDDWTPGSLPAFIAGPALLASVTFLAAENAMRLAGVTWNRLGNIARGRDTMIQASQEAQQRGAVGTGTRLSGSGRIGQRLIGNDSTLSAQTDVSPPASDQEG